MKRPVPLQEECHPSLVGYWILAAHSSSVFFCTLPFMRHQIFSTKSPAPGLASLGQDSRLGPIVIIDDASGFTRPSQKNLQSA